MATTLSSWIRACACDKGARTARLRPPDLQSPLRNLDARRDHGGAANFRLGMDAATGVARVEVLTGSAGFQGERRSRKVPKGFGALAETGRPPAATVSLLKAPTPADLPPQVERAGAVQLSGTERRGWLPDPDRDRYPVETLLFDGISQQPQVRSCAAGWRLCGACAGSNPRGLEGYDAYHSFRLHARPEPPFLARPGQQATVPKSCRPSLD